MLLKKDPLIQYLKDYFNKQDNCNALLILDDVYDEKIIITFDFKCKTLVLTDDIGVLNEKKLTYKTIQVILFYYILTLHKYIIYDICNHYILKYIIHLLDYYNKENNVSDERRI